MTKELEDVLGSFEQNRDSLIPVLQAVQGKFGYLSPEAVEGIADYLSVSESSIYGVATFYTQFKFARSGDHMVKVCLGTACHVKGSHRILEGVKDELGIEPGQSTKDYKFSLERVACVGCCALAPVMIVDNAVHAKMTLAEAKKILNSISKASNLDSEVKHEI